MKTLLREPLLHFGLAAALLFAANAWLSRSAPPAPTTLTVTQGQIRSLTGVFERIWQRTPTSEEREKLVEDFIRDEVFYREGVALGLDRDDALIRRRVRQKVELLAEDAQAPSTASDAELQAYLEVHRARFVTEPRVSFRQAYLDPLRKDRNLERETGRLLTELQRIGDADAAKRAGDSTLLTHHVASQPISDVAREFGEAFAASLGTLPPGRWQGPVLSTYGVHVVLITERTAPHLPKLDQVRAVVHREWSRERQIAASDKLYHELRRRYTVAIEAPASAPAPAP